MYLLKVRRSHDLMISEDQKCDRSIQEITALLPKTARVYPKLTYFGTWLCRPCMMINDFS